MSITTLTEREILRTEQAALQELARPRAQVAARKILQDLQAPLELADRLEPRVARVAISPPVETTRVSSAIDGLTKYIPTEAVTLYVGAVSALSASGASGPAVEPWALYAGFAVLTPILFLLVFIGKRRTVGLPRLPKLARMPWWKLVSSTIAFLVWALAVPGGVIEAGATSVAAAFGAVFVSTLLSLLEPIFENPAPAVEPAAEAAEEASGSRVWLPKRLRGGA